MKTWLITLLLALAIGRAYGLPVGNPAEPALFCCHSTCDEACSVPCDFFVDLIDLRIGFYGDYVFNRHLKTVTQRKIDYTQMFTNAGYLALNFCQRFDLFTTLGVTKFSFNTNLEPFNSDNPSPCFDFESNTMFSWSVGVRTTLVERNCFVWGITGQYFSSWPTARVLFVRANVDAHPDETSRRKYTEWQIGTGISYRYSEYFVPYIALKYTDVLWRFNNELFSVTGTLARIPNLRNRSHWGFAFGVSLAPFACDRIVVTTEGRFGDESALYVNGQICF